MNIKNLLWCGAIAGIVMFGSGCGLFDNQNPKEEFGTIPGGADDPDKDLNIDGSGNKWGAGANDGSLAGNKDNWTPVPGLNFPPIYFGYDKDVIIESERPKLSQVASYLQSNGELGLIIEGNCDDRGSNEYNRALGERRAIAAKNYLTSLGIPESRLKTISYGEDKPAVQGETEEARAKNRRDELDQPRRK